MVAAYFVLRGLSVKKAIQKIIRLRKSANPNKRQVEALNQFARSILKIKK